MTHFCDNPMCRMHEYPAAPTTEVLTNDKILTISSHLCGALTLCAGCVNAIAMKENQE